MVRKTSSYRNRVSFSNKGRSLCFSVKFHVISEVQPIIYQSAPVLLPPTPPPSPEIKRQEHEGDHLPPSCADIKMGLAVTQLPLRLRGVMLKNKPHLLQLRHFHSFFEIPYRTLVTIQHRKSLVFEER